MGANTIFIIVSIAVAVFGYILGFGKTLKLATNGIFGIAISIIVCVMLGGMVMGIEFIHAFVERMNSYFTGFWSFLNVIHFGTIIYYIVFFFVVQLLRVIVVKIVSKLFDNKNKVMKVVNNILGGIFLPAFCLGVLLIVFAGFKAFETSSVTINFLVKIEDTILIALYKNNPIVF